jgi:hypothetical protein
MRRDDRILLWDNSKLYNNKLTRTQDIARIQDNEDTVMTTRMLSNVMIIVTKYYNI